MMVGSITISTEDRGSLTVMNGYNPILQFWRRIVPVIENYFGLARKLAWRARSMYNIEWSDAYSDALLGLAEANKRCTEEKTFAGYARIYMWGRILKGIRSRSFVRSDSNWIKQYGHQPYMVEIEPLALSQEDNTGQVFSKELWDIVEEVLTERESYVVCSYYRFGIQQSEIAEVIGVSQMQVSRILCNSCKKLAQHEELRDVA